MAPRRPNSATESDSRMPFAAAEALLWGPEMKQQHAHLLTAMQTLQRHHEAYDARIRSAEHVVEAAEAATARVRHLEQQLAAIEAEDDNKAFEKWTAGEITRMGIFVDTNKHVRQKQIELDNAVSHAVEDLDKLRQVPREVKGILRRLDILEAGRNQDARRIKSLEEQVIHLKTMRQDATSNTAGLQIVSRPQQGIMRSMTPSQLLNAEISDATTETEDEDLMLMRRDGRDEIQVPRSPETREKKPNTMSAPSVPPGHPVKSARHRLMQRPSIHDSMFPQMAEKQRQTRTPAPGPSEPVYDAPAATQLVHHDHQSRDPAPAPAPAPIPMPSREPRPRARIVPPPTQLAHNAVQRKRKLPTKEPQTQRLTRAQAKRCQEQEAEERKQEAESDEFLPSTQLVGPALPSRKKQKTANDSGSDHVSTKPSTSTRTAGGDSANTNRFAAAGSSKNTAIEPTQLVTSSSTRANIPKASMSPVKKRSPLPVQPKATNKQKQKSLIVVLRSPRKATGIEPSESDDMHTTATDRVINSPRKAAAAPLPRSKAASKPPSARNTASRPKRAAGTGTGTRRNPVRGE